jgi:predicted dehydrogenase
MRERMTLAVVGTGYFSQFHLDAWSRLDVPVTAICSLNKFEATKAAKKIKHCAIFDDYNKMLDTARPAVVDIIVPPAEQVPIIKAAIDRGIHIICQKPFTNSFEEAQEVVCMARSANVQLLVHENFRFQPWHMQIKKMIDQKIIGEPFQITVRMRPGDGQGKNAYLNRQPYFQKMERFLIHETGIHFIDLFRHFFGEIESVLADLVKLNQNISGEDSGIVIFKFKNKVRGIFDGNRLSDHIAQDRRRTIGDFIVEGSKGSIRLNGDGDVFFRSFGTNLETKIQYSWKDIGFAGDSVYFCQKHMIESILSKSETANSGMNYLENLRVERAIYNASFEGKTKKVT